MEHSKDSSRDARYLIAHVCASTTRSAHALLNTSSLQNCKNEMRLICVLMLILYSMVDSSEEAKLAIATTLYSALEVGRLRAGLSANIPLNAVSSHLLLFMASSRRL